jgi:hypothetical protein
VKVLSPGTGAPDYMSVLRKNTWNGASEEIARFSAATLAAADQGAIKSPAGLKLAGQDQWIWQQWCLPESARTCPGQALDKF